MTPVPLYHYLLRDRDESKWRSLHIDVFIGICRPGLRNRLDADAVGIPWSRDRRRTGGGGAFFSGLALGAWVLDRTVSSSNYPGRWYSKLEFVVGLWALVLSVGFPSSGILSVYQLDMPVFKTIVRTFLEVFPEASAYLAHFSLANPMIGLVGGGPLRSAEPNWFDRRVGQGVLRERLKALQLRNVYEFLGCYLAGAEQLSLWAGTGTLNTDDHPVVMFEAPRFVYTEQEPASNRLFALIDSLAPRPADVLPAAEGREGREARDRLAAYWAARNRFLHAGEGVPRTGDVRELLSYVRKPLLEVVRMSSDFDPAYRPLLAMAEHLVRIDPDAGRNLVVQLIDANPARSEARRILGSLTPTLPLSSGP